MKSQLFCTSENDYHNFIFFFSKLIRRANWIQCPLCRQVLSCSSTDDLPNILHILKLQAKMAKENEKHQDEIEFLTQSLKYLFNRNKPFGFS